MYSIPSFPMLNYDFLERIPGVFGVKNREGQYVALNQECAEMFGYENPETFIEHGGTDKDLRAPAADLAEQFILEDQRVFKQKASQKTFVSGIYADQEVSYYYGEKIYLDDQYIAFQHRNIADLKSLQLLNIHQLYAHIKKKSPKSLSNQGTICLEERYQEFKLSKRQTEVLYLLIVGKVMREIALILKISQRTVETHLEVIKERLGCKTKGQLIAYAIENGFLSRVPESLVYEYST